MGLAFHLDMVCILDLVILIALYNCEVKFIYLELVPCNIRTITELTSDSSCSDQGWLLLVDEDTKLLSLLVATSV